VPLLLEDEHVVAVGDDVLDPQAHQRAQLLGRLARLLQQRLGPLEQRVHQLVADGAQEMLLGGEVVVEAARGEAERLRQLGHRGLVVAPLGEHACGTEHDLGPPAVVALAQGGSGRPHGHASETTE
jgi:hypothetical protein